MNKIKSTILAAAILVCALTLISSQANAQTDPRTVVGPDTLANSSVVIPAVEGRGTLVKYYGFDRNNWLACGPASGDPTYGRAGVGETLIFSFGQSRHGPIGSWTVRSLFPAEGKIAEHASGYDFDGIFTSGSVDVSGSSRNFDLRGRTTYTGICRPYSDPARDLTRDVRVWGNCADEGAVLNFEVTEGGRLYARGTFRNNSHAVCALTAQSNINLTLNRH